MKKEKLSEEEQIKSSISPEKKQETKKPHVTEQEKQSLMDLLGKQADEFAYKSKNQRRESELAKVKFILRGKEISLGEIWEIIVANALPYTPRFSYKYDFYKEIYRLMEWDGDYKKYYKDRRVADFTNKVIYGRFSPDVLPSIQALNGYLPGCWVRGYKNFQFLNEEGQKMVEKYRDDAIEVMKTCETMHEFRIKFREAPYYVPYSYQQKITGL